MSFPVYSERFVSTNLPGAWFYWTCPGGKRAVVRSISCVSGGAAGSSGWVMIHGVAVYLHVFQASNVTDTLDVRHVVYQGEQLGAFLSHDSMYLTVSGYLFDDGGASTAAPGAHKPVPMAIAGELPTEMAA